jgi:hypothetical protein
MNDFVAIGLLVLLAAALAVLVGLCDALRPR